MSSIHSIVILGASYAGIGVAHGLLKALPDLKKETRKDFKVTIIANSTHFWFSVGAPRAMLYPYPQDVMDSFIPVEKGFKQYPSDQFEFVHAEITGLETKKRDVLYKLKDDKAEIVSGTKTLHFDTLVIATGATGPSPLYSLHGSHIPTLEAYKDIHARLPAAERIMVVGGGSAGTETAGELGHLHGKNTKSPKDITILSGSDRLLPDLRPAIAKRAQEFLTDMGVKVEHNLRLKDSKPAGGNSTEVTLSDGSTRLVDILIEAVGRTPASSFLSPSILDGSGRVVADPYMRVASLESAYVCGDVSSLSQNPSGLVHMQTAVPTCVGNIKAELTGKGAAKEFKPMSTKETQFVPVGPNSGVGAAFGWWVPSIAVKMIKGKDFMFPKALKNVMGT
ncbi:hypothetical protein MMC21_005472 [Puttea exsequens]|nr:hypothetical protein [Puttea exsequens]